MIGPFDQTSFASSELHLQINCTGFTDSELDPLSRVDSVIKRPLYSTNLPSLKLTGYYDFIIQVLKDVVNTRDVLAGRFSNNPLRGETLQILGGFSRYGAPPVVR